MYSINNIFIGVILVSCLLLLLKPSWYNDCDFYGKEGLYSYRYRDGGLAMEYPLNLISDMNFKKEYPQGQIKRFNRF